jgi:RHS repeat-associated protein
LGLVQVTVQASDPAGATASQTFLVNVLPPDQPPTITSTPGTAAKVGALYQYDLRATDPDGDPLTYRLISAPQGASFTALGQFSWVPAGRAVGTNHVELAVSDGRGGEVTQPFDITVAADTKAPDVQLITSPEPVQVGKPLTLIVAATDDTGLVDASLTFDGRAVALDGSGHATLRPTAAGTFEAVATATDVSGNVRRVTATVTVIDPAAAGAPEVDITAPEADAVVSGEVDVVGSVSSASLRFYTLAVGLAPDGPFHTIATGSTPVSKGVLGRLDTTALADDSYILRLVATDANGQTATLDEPFSVAGRQKPGNFTLSFTDLNETVGGVAVTVARTYDTLTADQSVDFGYGWRLEFRDVNLRSSVPLTGQENDGFYNPFRDGTRVYVTLPGGRREGFTFQPEVNRLTQLLNATVGLEEDAWEYDPVFVPDAGNTSRLAITGAVTLIRDKSTGEYFSVGGDRLPFNPADGVFFAEYVLTTRDGVAYHINAEHGLLDSVVTPTGVTLNYTNSSISSSLGGSIKFARDAQGRITTATSSSGKQVSYRYDARGDLVAVTDSLQATTTFAYDSNHPHYLVSVTNPEGKTGARVEYDDQGRIKSVTDANGNPSQVLYDATNSTETVFDANGHPTTFSYDELGNVTAQVDALHGVTHYTYDASGRLLSRTDPLGRTSQLTYDAAGNLLTSTDALGNTTRMTYDTAGRVLTSTDPLGNTISLAYDGRGNVTSVTDATGTIVTRNTFDAYGHLLTTTDALGDVTRFAYNGLGQATSATDALGAVTTYGYDADGRQTTQTTTRTDATGQTVPVTVGLNYDAKGKLLASTNPDGPGLTFTYDSSERPTTLRDPGGQTIRYTYDDNGNRTGAAYDDGTTEGWTYDAKTNPLTYTDRQGRTTRYEYDALDRLTKLINPDGTFTTRSYDAAGQVTDITDENGHTTHYDYDANGHVVKQTDPLGLVTSFTYDPLGNVTSMTDPAGHTTRNTYDAAYRKTQVTYADGSTEVYAYDAAGRLSAQTDPEGSTTRFEYDALGHIVKVTDALGNVTRYAYDEMGNKVSQTDANGHVTHWAYDDQHRVVRHVLPAGQSESFTYDARGNVASHTDFNGQTTTFTYDANGHLLQKAVAGQTTASFTYDAAGETLTATDAQGTTRYTYDARGHLASVTQPDGEAVSYSYDAAGNRTSVTTVAGTTTYSYNADNRMETVTDPASGVTRYTYDADGNVVQVDRPNGITETRQYDALNRVVAIRDTSPGGDVTWGETYTLNRVGNRTDVEGTDGSHVHYGYDADHQLVNETVTGPSSGTRTINYSYDAVGNRLTRDDSVSGPTAYSYDVDDRLVTESTGGRTTRYSYDANGNTLSRITDAVDQALYEWDTENRLVRADVTTPAGTTRVDYGYDAEGNRVSMTQDGRQTRYQWDTALAAPQVLTETDASGTVTASYVRGVGLISADLGGHRSYVVTDALGSVRALADASGAVTDRYTYGAFGEPLQVTGSTPNVYRFAGEALDLVTGLYNLRARQYDTAPGRFLSQDPFTGVDADPITLNKYVYASNNPTNHTDPTGRFDLGELCTALAVTGILASLSADAVLSYKVLNAIPPNAFTSFPDAAMAGYSVSVSPTNLILKIPGAAENPIGDAVAVALSLTNVVGGVDFLFPASHDRVWIYGYAGASFSSSFQGLKGLTPGGVASINAYVGFVWNVKDPMDYAGYFISASLPTTWLDPTLLARWIPNGATLFTSPEQGGSYGVSAELGAVSTAQSSSGQSASWTYYWYDTEIVVNLPPIDLSFEGLRKMFGPLLPPDI